MTTDDLVLDCINKGFNVTFRGSTGSTWIECCIERRGQFPGAKPFSGGDTMFIAAREAARYAGVPGY